MTRPMAAPVEDTRSTPYRDAAWTYRAAGWRGVLPIPYRRKTYPPGGWTGNNGAWPSGSDIAAWCESTRPNEGGGNIALRLPRDVIGVDVDAYGDKHGADTLAEAVGRWGPLPDTWMSTSRDDGRSGIRLFRVPEGLRWPGEVGPGIETVHTAHRYVMAWPSVHPEGGTYRWCRPDGVASLAPPRVDELPDLPDAWVVGLTGGIMAEDVRIADLTPVEVTGWLAERAGGHLCRAMRAITDRFTDDLTDGSAHESLRHLMSLVRFAEQGHTGLIEALGQAHAAFLAETTKAGRHNGRDTAEAEAEWSRSLAGAVRRVRGDSSIGDGDIPTDPCTNPFHGLVPPDLTGMAPPPAPPAVDESPAAPAAPTPAVPLGAVDEVTAFLLGADTPAAVQPEQLEPPAPVEEEHTSWWPRDPGPALSGEQSEPEPCVLDREDGHSLFYAGKVNGLLGESESGKSWLLLVAVAQQLQAQRPVLMFDFEDTIDSTIARLQAMGVDPKLLDRDAGLFDYVAPDEGLNAMAYADFHAVMHRADYGLIGLDGYNAAMTLLGLDLSSNPDATKFAQWVLRPLAKTGAAVVTVDHVGKDKEARGKGGIGAQAKRAMTTGCQLSVDVLAPFGRGQTGKLKLVVDKDRPGHVRGFADNSKNVGIAVLESGSNGSVNVRIEAPGSAGAAMPSREPFRPTGIMEKISRLLSTTDGMLTQRQIESSVPGRATVLREALERLVEDGYISRHAGPNRAILHRYERTYRELGDLVADERNGDDDRGGW